MPRGSIGTKRREKTFYAKFPLAGCVRAPRPERFSERKFWIGQKKHVFWLSKRAKHDPDPLSLRSSPDTSDIDTNIEQTSTPRYFINIPITTPIVSALKLEKMLCLELSRSPNDFFKCFWIRNPGMNSRCCRFTYETAVRWSQKRNGRYHT